MRNSRTNSPNAGPIPPRHWWIAPLSRTVKLRSGHVVRSDSLTALRRIRAGIADVVFLDPPFNLGKSYGKSGGRADRKHEADYDKFLSRVIEESVRVLRPGGALFLYHIPRRAVQLLPELTRALRFRHWIAIGMKNGFVRNGNLYPAHYALLHFTKGDPSILHRPKVQPPTCPHCGEVIRDYGGYSEHVVDGVNLSDFWDDLSPVRHTKHKFRRANELPMVVVKRVVEIAGEKGGLLIDAFAGTGGASVAARKKGMRYIAIDREAANCSLIVRRMNALTRHRKTPHA